MPTGRTYNVVAVMVLLSAFVSCNNQEKNEHAGHPDEQDAGAVRNIALDDLLKPTNAFVISSIPVTTIQQKAENIELDVPGNVVYDTRQIGTVASRVSGRIEKLYIKYKYQRIQKGQKVMDIYSPELATAQQQLLFLVRNDPDNTTLINAAGDRLELLGLHKQQINQIVSSKQIVDPVPVYSSYTGFATDFPEKSAASREMNAVSPPAGELRIKEGMYLQKGEAAFSVYNADKVWILLNIYPEQQALIKVGNPVQVVPETSSGQGFRAKIDYIEPFFRTGSKTLTARVYFDNAVMRLPIGSRVKATIFGNAINAAWLPKEAVLSLGKGNIVFVKEDNGFRAKEINTGLTINNSIQVMKGLSATDSVAVNAHYLADNEAFIKTK